MHVTSYGAAREVTGSCHLLEVGNEHVLIDCGLFQGGARLEAKNHDPFPFEPERISQVFLTHAHLDHCGRLPLLVKRGFRGEIITSAATVEVVKFILLDAAHVMHEEYLSERRHRRRRGESLLPPLYDETDVLETLNHLAPVRENGRLHDVGPHLRVAFHNAGHILGSRFLQIEAREGGQTQRITFGGDLGNPGRSVMPDYAMPQPCDVVYCESTYGDRDHRDHDGTIQEFEAAVRDCLGRGGNVVIPSFALERSQDVLFALEDMERHGRLPKKTKVFLNSPLAIHITRVYQRFPGELGSAVRRHIERGDDPFHFPGVRYSKTERESRELNDLEGGNILIAGSGMCNGGRVLHHLKHNLWREESSVILVGYQAKDSLGRLLVEGRERVKIFGEEIAVRAKVHTVNGFSAHAGQSALLDWLEATGDAEVRLVHGESNGLDGLKSKLEARGRRATIVEEGEID